MFVFDGIGLGIIGPETNLAIIGGTAIHGGSAARVKAKAPLLSALDGHMYERRLWLDDGV